MRRYLVRRKAGAILGPLSSEEFMEAYGNDEFDVDDEIAGSCNKWVYLKDLDTLAILYPKIHSYMANKLMSAYGSQQGFDIDQKVEFSFFGLSKKSQYIVLCALLLISLFAWHSLGSYCQGRVMERGFIYSFCKLK